MSEEEQGIEYSVVVFFQPEDLEEGAEPSEVTMTTENMEEAMKEADKLSADPKYLRVDVNKKFFDEKNNRVVDIPLKSFNNKERKALSTAVLLAIAVACGLVSFGASFAVSKFVFMKDSPAAEQSGDHGEEKEHKKEEKKKDSAHH